MNQHSEIFISTRGVERPISHIISVNDNLINIAYELESIVLLGVPLANTDRRLFNIDVRLVRDLLNKERQGFHMFNRVKTKISKAMNAQDELKIKGSTDAIANVAHQGMEYLLIYYLLCKHKPMPLEGTTNYECISKAFNVVDTILAPLRVTAVDLKLFADFTLTYRNAACPIVSNAVCLTRSQILNSADLTHPLWRTLYITRILRNIPTPIRNCYFRPAVDWAFVQCATKYFFSCGEQKTQATRGDNINFISMTAKRQVRAMDILDDTVDENLQELKRITNLLQTKLFEIDYTLGDLALITFSEDIGVSFFGEVERTLSTSERTLVSPLLADHEQLKYIVLQYLYTLFLLTQNGIIHNDVRLQSILLVPVEPSEQRRKRVYQLMNGKSVELLTAPIINLMLVDFHKSLLSRHHHDFAQSATLIEQEIRTALNMKDKEMTKDYDVIFNCYAMYDVVQFCLLLRIFFDTASQREKDTNPTSFVIDNQVVKKNQDFLGKIIKTAKEIIQKMFLPGETVDLPFKSQDTHGSMQWLIETIYAEHTLTESVLLTDPVIPSPEFISSRRKHSDALKFQYIAHYAANS